jgi:miniconductance mechanosensitive channel
MVTERIADILTRYGMGTETAETVSIVILFSAVLAAGFLIRFILSRLVNGAVRAYATRTKNTWDDALVDKRVFDRIANFVPAMLMVATAGEYGSAAAAVERLASALIILNFIYVIAAVFDAGECI